jgi:predicted DNA-binding transcriptional regulator AlpA
MAKKIFRKKFLSANGKKFLRVGAVALRYDTSTSTIWRWSHEERFAHLNFPKPIPLGPNTTAWAVDELDQWDAERVAKRDDGGEDEAA